MLTKKTLTVTLGFLMFLVFITPLISAMGIAPAYFEIPYKPGEEATYECFIRTGGRESNIVRIYAEGDLNNSITIDEKKITVEPEQWTKLQFKIKFPRENISPGLHENRLGVVESGNVERSGVSVLTGVETRLFIRVPFEGRFLELKSFEIPAAEVNKPVNFYATVISRGKENIDSAVMHLDISDPQGQLIAKIKSDSITIKNDGEATLSAQWQTDVPGPYSANGFIIYDNNFLELGSKGFNVGDLLLKIESIITPDVTKGEIAKIYFDVKSFWNAGIENVYAELIVKDKLGNIIGGEKSPTLTVKAWDKVPVVMYWDSRSQEAGEYEGKIVLYYSGKTDEAATIIKIRNPFILTSLKENPLLMIIAIIILITLIFNIIFFLKIRKKKEK